jgi:hypothetical protein
MVMMALALVGCPTATLSSGGGTPGIRSSSGTLSGASGSWSFDAGAVPQYTTDTVTFTVTNSTSTDFNATGSQTFTPSGDFSDSLSGSFDVAAQSSNSFTGSISPTGTPGTPETGAVTLTPSSGTPITINLKVTPDTSFQVKDPFGTQIIPPAQGQFYTSFTLGMSIVNNSSTATITLTGGPNYVTITGTGYSVYTEPASATIPPLGTATFQIQDANSSSGNVGTITISGVNSLSSAPFTFVGSIVDHAS